MSSLDAVKKAFKELDQGEFDEFFHSVAARLTDNEDQATLKDGMKIVGILVESLASFKIPGKHELASGLQTPQMRHAVDNVGTILLGAFERLRSRRLPVEDQHPGSLLILMLDEGLKGLSYSELTTHQIQLRLYFVEVVVDNLLRSIQSHPQDWAMTSEAQKKLAAIAKGEFNFDHVRLEELREQYRSWAQHAHGTIVNPVMLSSLCCPLLRPYLSPCIELSCLICMHACMCMLLSRDTDHRGSAGYHDAVCLPQDQ